METKKDQFDFPTLNDTSFPNLRTKNYASIYDIPIEIYSRLRGIEDLKLYLFILQGVDYHTNVLDIDASWRKEAVEALNIDFPRLSKALQRLDEIDFISIVKKQCRVNPYLSSKGPSLKRNSVLDKMEGKIGIDYSALS